MKVAITGVTGNMGQQTLFHILKLKEVEEVKVLVSKGNKRLKKLLRAHRKDKKRIVPIIGRMSDREACKELVKAVDYVINMAAVIPPKADQFPLRAIDCNQKGTDILVDEIEKLDKQPKLIHISTMALYGDRNYLHPWGRVGDPLLVSPYDVYAATKLRGEFRVLESAVENWVVLRQTAMLHKNMLSDNMSDGLMFHTCFNSPLEWVTAYDSGKLIANILEKDQSEDLSKVFWKRCYNIGGGSQNRLTGYESFNGGFKLIGGSAEDFYKPYYHATRNFHGLWFYDSNVLDDMFHYLSQSTDDYWQEIKKSHKYYSLAKLVPKSWISKFAIQRLFKSPNSPSYWKKHGDKVKLTAYFGGEKEYDALPHAWKDFNLLAKGENPKGEEIDYDSLKNIKNAKLIDLGFSYDKKDEEITLQDLQNVAKMHGGKLLSKTFDGDMYEKLEWYTQDNERFIASAYTILRAGHWYNVTYEKNAWDFDRLSKKDKVYSQLWYDSHTKEENNYYYYDNDFVAKIKGKNKKG